MAYIGRPLQVSNLAVQSGTGDGSDTTPIATLDYATTTNGIAVYLDGVRQLAGTDYTVSGTTLTFTTAPPNGVGIDVYFLGLELSLPVPSDGSVSTAKIVNNAVDETKLKDALIGDFTDATVTASDTFLHGDASDSGNTKRDTIQGILDLASPSVNVDTFTIDQSTTGSQSVTGVGFQPVGVFFNCVQSSSDEASFGFSDGTTEKAIRDENGQTSDTWSWSNSSIHLIQDGSNNSSAVVASFDADGFTLTKSKSGSPTGTNQVTFLAIG